MLQTDLTLINPLGLHARAASKLVDLAKTFASDIRIATAGKEVDGKSIMNILLLGAPVGTELTLIVEGEDEDAAFAGVCELISAGFHELDD
jgi:phosphocarrier protein